MQISRIERLLIYEILIMDHCIYRGSGVDIETRVFKGSGVVQFLPKPTKFIHPDPEYVQRISLLDGLQREVLLAGPLDLGPGGNGTGRLSSKDYAQRTQPTSQPAGAIPIYFYILSRITTEY